VVRGRDEVTGVLLVGGASRRFGSPKALALYGGETLAERGHRVLLEAFGRVLVVGKAGDGLELPFPLVDDGSEVRAAIVGVAAALREADADVCVVLPTDMPHATPALLRSLAEAAEGVDAAVPQTGPLPGAYRRTALPVLERRIAEGDLALHRSLAELDTRVVECDEALLMNVNEPADLR
jgi:molybdopterin-guanine dinucleotide biosynthesis protein A